MAYTGPKKFSKKVKTKPAAPRPFGMERKAIRFAGHQEGRQLLCPVSRADEEEPESSQEPQLTAPPLTQEVEVQRLKITEKLMPNVSWREVPVHQGRNEAAQRSGMKKGRRSNAPWFIPTSPPNVVGSLVQAKRCASRN